MSSVFSHHGNPLSIVSDNSVQLMSAAFLEGRNIRHHRSSLYYLATNGAVEIFNCVFKHIVQVAIQQQHPWKPVVTDFLQVYSATGTSPFQLLYGRQMCTWLSILPSAPVHPKGYMAATQNEKVH